MITLSGPSFDPVNCPDGAFSALSGSLNASGQWEAFVTEVTCFEAEPDNVFATARLLPPVPLPAGGLLLLSGLAGAAALGRRKSRA